MGVDTEMAPSFELKWNFGCFWKYKGAFAMMTATTRKTSRQSEVVMILRLSHLVHTMLVNYAPRGLVCTQLNSTQRHNDLWLYAQAVIKTAIVVISCPFPEDVRISLKCVPYQTHALWLFFLTRPIKFFICELVVAIPLSMSKLPINPSANGNFFPTWESCTFFLILWCLLVPQVLLFIELVFFFLN